jgi:hypothetical protein
MAKVARVGIRRDPDLIYYVKNGDVYASPRKKPGRPKGKARLIAQTRINTDYGRFIYFVDSDGDVASKARKNGR